MYKTLRFMLVSLLMMLCGTVFADEVTFDFTGNEGYGMTLLSGSTSEYNADPTTCTNGDVTLTLNGKTRWWKTNNGNQLRFYKESSMTLNVESGTITKVELTASAPKNFSGDNYANGVWEGSAQSVTINCDITSSNTPVTVIKVTYTPGTSDTRSATSITLGDHATSGTVGESMNLPTATVCEVTGAPVSNATVTWESTNTDVATIANGKINFVAAGTSTIKASFAGDNTYKPSSASFTLTVNLPSAGTFYSFAELQTTATSTSTPLTFVFNGQQVVYVNGSNAFLTDEKGYGVMIFTNGHGLTAGDKLTGSIDCNMVLYQGATEITGFSKEGLTITNEEVVPVERTIGELQFANQSTLVTLKDVMYESGTKVFYEGTDSIVFYDKFKTNVTLEENHKYNVTGVLILYYDSKNSSTYLEICPRSANDVVDLGEVDIPDTPKYYVIGNMTEWKVNENYKMTLNAAATSEEYMLETTFAAGDEIKVVKDGAEALVWYPADGGNYTIDAAGDYTVYFRPAGDGGNDWYYGCIYVYAKPVPTETDVTFDFNASDHAVSATGINDGDIVSNEVLVEGGVTMTITPNAKGTANRYWGTNNGPQLRMYGGKIIIVAPEGKAIKKATFNNGKWSNDNTFNGEVASSKEWEGNSSNLVLEVAANTQLNNVVVTIGNKDNETTTYMATFTATFSTNADWNKVYAYAWTNRDTYAEKFLGEWPGTEITLDAETGKYSLTFTAAEVPAMILFNDGGSNQTADLVFVDGKDYEYDANAEQTVTVTFSTDLGWNKVYAYAYSISGDMVKKFTADWPGDELQANNDNIFTYSYTGIETPDSIIFNNGIEGDGKDQTPEFMFQDGRHYTYNTLDKAREELRSFILEVEALYNDHKDDVPAESQQEIEDAIEAAWRVYWDSNATEESLAQAKDDLQAAMIKAQSDALGLSENVTDKFSQFEWVSDLGEVTVNKDNDLSQVLMNTTDGTGKVIYKTVTGLQNGTYDVKLEGGAIDDGTGTRVLLHDGEEGRVVLFANNVALSLPVRFSDQNSGTQHMELKNVVVSDGTMELGMQKLAPGSNWHLINIEKVKMLSYTKQVADEDGQNADWQVVKKTILDDQSYSSVQGEPRETLQAAETKADIMAAIPAFYAAYVPVQSEDVYSVAGEPADLFGYYWNEKATETEMTLNKDGLYEWSKENVTLAGGAKVEFKVVKNHDWNNGANAWPVQNYVLEIPENGKYTVVITFDAASETVNATATKTGDATIENAEITSVELRGDFSDWGSSTDFTLVKSETADNVWTMTLNLTEMTYDPKFKLVVNGSEWIGNNQMEIVAPDNWVDSAYDQDNNLILYHTNTGYNTYTVTATWDPNANADQGWTLKFEGKDQREEITNAEITQVELRGDFNNWTNEGGVPFILTKDEKENIWRGVLDLTEMTYDPKFKLVVNEKEWIGNNEMEIEAPDKWVDSAYDQDNNLKIQHSVTGYNTYTVTATWTPNPNAKSGWTLKFEGKDEKNPVVMNYYSAVFKTNASWDKVYAYAWSGQDPNVTEFLGGWPGKEIGFNEKNNQYELDFEAETMPEFIIFNNGSDEQTENLPFVNQNMYEYYLPVVDFASVYKGQPAKEGDFFIYNVESGLWLQNNEKNTGDWNTRGATGTYGFAFGLRIIDGGWQLDPKFGHNHSMNASNFYLDTNDGLTTWTLTPVVTQDGKKGYYINAGDNRLTLDDNDNLAWNTEKGTVWQLVTREDRINYLTENATSENPLDATFLIMDPSFANENERASSWTWNRAGGNLDDVRWYRNRRSYAVWNCNSFSLTQNIQNVPNGTYSLTFKGFYRDGNKDDVAARRTAGTERFIGKYFINEDKADVMSILDGANDQWIDGLFFYPAADADAPYGHYPDNADGFNRIFQDYPNAYLNAGVQSVVTTKAMTIGLEKLEQNSNDWIAFDDFRLTYLGPVDISAFTDALNAAIAEAEGLNTDNTSAAVKGYLAEALAIAKSLVNSQDTDELSQATANLVAAIEAVKTVDVTILQKTVEVAEEGIDVTAANRVITEAMTADEVNQALYDLRAARKIKSMHMPDIYTGSAPAEGDVYLFNIGSGTFLGTGSDWNTHAAVDQAGIVINMIPDGNRFKFKTNRGNGWLSYNGYVDAGGQDGWVFMPVEGKTNVYNISSTGNDGNLLGYDPNGGTDGAKYWSTIAIDRKGIDNPMNQWKVVTVSERTELMAQANENKPIDATHLIKNASLNRQDGYDMWEKTGGDRKSTNNNNDRSENFGWEFYNTQSMNFGQTITGLRPGIYEVSVQAFYRDGNGNYQSGVVNQGGELLQLAYLYANDEKQPLMNIADPSVLDKVPGSATMNSDFGAFPNWPEEAFEFFETGYYKNTVRVVVNESGSLTIGIAKDEKQNDGDWIVLDNFRLKYLGTEPAEPIETMSIVGDFTGGWPTAEGDWSMAKDMTQSTENPAIWTLHIENFEVVFEEGQTERKYEYKATANHKWGVYQLPADDSNQDWFFGNDRTYKAGVYDLDFTVDTENHTLTLVPTFDEVGSGIRDINAADGNQMIYNLNGQKVTNVKKGLYIVNGKKTIKR